MQLITGLTANPTQQQTVVLPDGTKLSMQLFYSQQQLGWFFLGTDDGQDGLNWNNGQWVENGRLVVNHGNMLRQYKNILDFGLACFTTGNREPTQLQDFSSGASSLYLLSAIEVLAFEAYLQAKKSA